MEPASLVMERKMLRGIKAAGRAARPNASLEETLQLSTLQPEPNGVRALIDCFDGSCVDDEVAVQETAGANRESVGLVGARAVERALHMTDNASIDVRDKKPCCFCDGAHGLGVLSAGSRKGTSGAKLISVSGTYVLVSTLPRVHCETRTPTQRSRGCRLRTRGERLGSNPKEVCDESARLPRPRLAQLG